MNQRIQTDLLKGVRVLDLSQYIPGPYASLQLAELGAEVIKVEVPGGDPMRTFGVKKGGISAFYTHLNRGKHIVELNLKQEEGQATFKELLSSANILLEGFRPGTLKRLGFAPENLANINPNLIVCSLSGFGQDGPDALRGGHDLGYAARAGLYSGKRTKPAPIFPPVADHAGALQALSAMLAALYQQEKTGRGCNLDISLVDPVLAWQYLLDSDAVSGHISGDAAYYNIYETADNRFVTLAALEAKFWSAFCTAVSRPEWVDRQAEPMPQTSLIAELNDLLGDQPLSYWQATFDGVDCCFEPVPLDAEAGQAAQAGARGLKNRFPGKVNACCTPNLPDYKFILPEDINWINE
jgi:alpha-methylacyl-CoA racemase